MFVLLERMLGKSYFQYALPLLVRVCSRYTSKNIMKELMKRKSWRIFKKCIWNVFKMYLFSTYLICSCPYGGCVFIFILFKAIWVYDCLEFSKMYGFWPNYANIFHKIFLSHDHIFLNSISDYTTYWSIFELKPL